MNLLEFGPKLQGRVAAAVDFHALAGTVMLKTEAPWHDDTGAARAGLHTSTSHSLSQHTIVFAHAVDYGIWLEIKNSGKYEVILPVLLRTGKDLMKTLNHVMRSM